MAPAGWKLDIITQLISVSTSNDSIICLKLKVGIGTKKLTDCQIETTQDEKKRGIMNSELLHHIRALLTKTMKLKTPQVSET